MQTAASTFKKVGVSFRKDILEKLDNYAEKKFRGNRSAAANYLLGALFQARSKCTKKTSNLLTSSRRQGSVSSLFPRAMIY